MIVSPSFQGRVHRHLNLLVELSCVKQFAFGWGCLPRASFRVRFDRLTLAEKCHLRAMAELGPGPHRSGDVADELERKVQSLGPTRSQLISKGMIWSPSHGDTAYTVPMFDEFMRRIMPGDDRMK